MQENMREKLTKPLLPNWYQFFWQSKHRRSCFFTARCYA